MSHSRPSCSGAHRHYVSFSKITFAIIIHLLTNLSWGQRLMLPDAVETGISNYGRLIAKNKYASAADARVSEVARGYLPSVNLAAQQSYGTINGQFGPVFGMNGVGGASGPYGDSQNWNAAFGALYFANVNWEVFSFGRRKNDIGVADAEASEYRKDYEQDLFQHRIKISSAYLNLLASQRLLLSQRKNLDRAEVFYKNVSVRVSNGLMPGVDQALARAEVSRAKITLNQVKEQVKTQNNKLVEFMGVEPQNFIADTTFLKRIPSSMISDIAKLVPLDGHPSRAYMESRIFKSEQQEKVARSQYFPSITAIGTYQARGSGFYPDYATDPSSFSSHYWDGVDPTRQNYLLGMGLVWDLTSISVAHKKLIGQKMITEGLKEENRTLDLELKALDDAANARLEYALDSYREAPKQVEAAQAAYGQRIALYENGLTTLTDVTTALFTLNRAETDRDIAFTNLWQALLLKASATGDFNLFFNEFK